MEIVSNEAQSGRPSGLSARTKLAIALVVAALALTSLLQSSVRATAQAGDVMQVPPSVATVPLHVAPDSGGVGRFAFGHLEFDWDPSGDIPGFGSWPLGTPRQ